MLIKRLKLKNLLSFGPEGVDLELRPLNVLIGPNGSGKSNLIEAIGLLRAVPRDLKEPFREEGVKYWIWRRTPGAMASITANIETPGAWDVEHLLKFAPFGEFGDFGIHGERLDFRRPGSKSRRITYDRHQTRLAVNNGSSRRLSIAKFDRAKSLILQLLDPGKYDELSELGLAYEEINIYRNWVMGPGNAARNWQPADQPSGRLSANFSNLALVLNRLRRNPAVKRRLIGSIVDFIDGAKDFDVGAEANLAQIFLDEGETSVPASRLSDGILRYLGLLAILLNPEPPALVCIDEPELGLHPDCVNSVAKLLEEASERMQLIVTTHSDVIVDALSHRPEDVVVCERGQSGSTMKRLDKKSLDVWLSKYTLGDLWSSGQIGGNRW